MQQMVEMQQETIVNIEKSSEGVNYELEEGNKHVTTAVSTAKSTRKVSAHHMSDLKHL